MGVYYYNLLVVKGVLSERVALANFLRGKRGTGELGATPLLCLDKLRPSSDESLEEGDFPEHVDDLACYSGYNEETTASWHHGGQDSTVSFRTRNVILSKVVLLRLKKAYPRLSFTYVWLHEELEWGRIVHDDGREEKNSKGWEDDAQYVQPEILWPEERLKYPTVDLAALKENRADVSEEVQAIGLRWFTDRYVFGKDFEPADVYRYLSQYRQWLPECALYERCWKRWLQVKAEDSIVNATRSNLIMMRE